MCRKELYSNHLNAAQDNKFDIFFWTSLAICTTYRGSERHSTTFVPGHQQDTATNLQCSVSDHPSALRPPTAPRPHHFSAQTMPPQGTRLTAWTANYGRCRSSRKLTAGSGQHWKDTYVRRFGGFTSYWKNTQSRSPTDNDRSRILHSNNVLPLVRPSPGSPRKLPTTRDDAPQCYTLG